MITPDQMKQLARDLGADLCGIAHVDRFAEAPKGFRPRDIYPQAKSVVVIAKRFPDAALVSENPVPYTFACDTILSEVHQIICQLSVHLQDLGVTAVPIPSEPYMYWDEERMEGRGIMSLRHAGYLAGLGILGRNTLLTNGTFGNRITLGALLLDAELKGDPIVTDQSCPDNCRACIDACPVKALDGVTVIQKQCREKSQIVTQKGYSLYVCNRCRVVCPNGKGVNQRS